MNNKHKVFVSYHHANDQDYRNKFESIFSNYYDVLVSKSVQIGDIDPYLSTEIVRQKIRDYYLRDSTVTVVLIGLETWKRKHVDWEIGSSIRQTQFNSRSGLLGIILPGVYNPTIPPRLKDNVDCGFAEIYNWSHDHLTVQRWIHKAYQNRNCVNPDNSYQSFSNNRT